MFRKNDPPYATDRCGKWASIWFYHETYPHDLFLSYDLIHNSAALKVRSEKRGTDQHEVIDEMCRGMARFIRGHRERYGNMSCHTASGLVLIGRLVHEPKLVHDGVTRMRVLMKHNLTHRVLHANV